MLCTINSLIVSLTRVLVEFDVELVITMGMIVLVSAIITSEVVVPTLYAADWCDTVVSGVFAVTAIGVACGLSVDMLRDRTNVRGATLTALECISTLLLS